MQLMWLSGPTGNVRTISITTRTVLTAAVVIGLFLVTAGFLLHFVGFKIAVEYNPDLARSKFNLVALCITPSCSR